jgi:hypothetical protein
LAVGSTSLQVCATVLAQWPQVMSGRFSSIMAFLLEKLMKA